MAADLPGPQPPILVLERTKGLPIPPCISQSDTSLKVEPSPHAHETSCCPIVEVELSSDTGMNTKRKRPKKKPREKARIKPSFWRPTPEMGGKSLGYAWGYAGSNPLALDERQGARYQRDTMRKAVFE